ncbi:DUF6932 family protein [Bosea thiooxidans]
MIPAFGPSGVLPPFVGNGPADRAQTSPYRASMTEIVQRFATSGERIAILRGLLDYRAALAAIGIEDGYQWLDGSFVEDCETTRNRAPGDIDVVTFAYRPAALKGNQDWNPFVIQNQNIFDPHQTKVDFRCDAYYIDLLKPPHIMVADTAYFNGLFSHHRDTAQWKGMLLVTLRSDDVAARQLL